RLTRPALGAGVVPTIGFLVAILVHQFLEIFECQDLWLGQDRWDLWALPLKRPHHDVPGHFELIARGPGLDGCRHVLRILAPIAQGADFSADRNRDHFSGGLPQGAQGSLLRGVLNDDAVQLARVGSEPFLDLGLRNLVRPHPSERTHHLMSGLRASAALLPLSCESEAEVPGIPSTTSTLP